MSIHFVIFIKFVVKSEIFIKRGRWGMIGYDKIIHFKKTSNKVRVRMHTMQIYDQKIKELLLENVNNLEKHFEGDVIYYFGPIFDGGQKMFRDFIEHTVLNSEFKDAKRLIFFIKTGGGSAEVTEVIVNLIRYYYKEVYFIVPDYAMSAGTILCMSGNKIYMDYSSYLGPVDPQLVKGKDEVVPVMGYLEKCEQMFKKSLEFTLSNAEFLMLKEMDLAFLSRCEHACELSKSLIETWLCKYLLKDNKTQAEKAANILADVSIWHSHGRYIGIDKLVNTVGIPISDYTNIENERKLIRDYSDLLTQFVERNKIPLFFHSRSYF